MDIQKLKEEFFNIYNKRVDDPFVFFSPGRVNLIGEHTDYNNGYVLPCALNYGTYLVIRKRSDDRILLHTLNFEFSGSYELDKIKKNKSGEWVNYPLGVISEFIDRKAELTGMDMLFYGNIPNGAGLSSSASIEMVTAFALNTLFSAGLSTLDLVKLSQHAENSFVGMNCGIMDQFAVGMGQEDSAVFLNCETLNYESVPLELKGYRLIISNTNKRRGLTDSKYNERRKECEEALKHLGKELDIANLSQLGIKDIDLLEKLIPDETILRRARHVVTENNRVLKAVRVLHMGDIEEFGKLMNESHDSLKNDYEVTGRELDALVYEAREIDGLIGSRMTGAGFGGCTVSIVKEDKAAEFTKQLEHAYSKATGLKADFYLPLIKDGVRQL